MDLEIEILIILIIIAIVFVWGLFTFVTKKYKLGRYKPENDKGKRAEESRQSSTGRSGREFINVQRSVLPERRNVFQAASASYTDEDRISNRKTSSSNGRPSNPFKKRVI